MRSRRQLTDEQTRVYAMGMSARRRGETKPKTYLPFELYKYWAMGWRRVKYGQGCIVMRSNDHTTQAEGVHMVRTEVATLDEALDVIEIQQRSRKAGQAIAANGKLKNWHRELHMSKIREKSPINGPKRRQEIAIANEAISEAELRLVQRIEHCIQLLMFSVEELSGVSAMRSHYPQISQSTLADIIRKLCLMLKKPMPEFGLHRTPAQKARPRCIECGAELVTRDTITSGYCIHCDPPNQLVHELSEFRREQGRVNQEIKRLEKRLRQTERVIDGDYERHGGHTSPDSANLETGGRTQDTGERSADAHCAGASGLRNAQGGNGGGASSANAGAPGGVDRQD